MSNNKTDFHFSPLIIGSMRLGDWGVRMSTSELEAFTEQCIELGLTDFDHADIYGHYTTESDFGKLFKQRPGLRQKIQITTKCGIKMISDNRPDHHIKSYNSSKQHIIQSVEHSLKALQTDYIDLLLIHRPDFLMNPVEVSETFKSLRTSGKVKHFGVSNFTPTQYDLLNHYYPLVTNQVEISLTHLNAFQDGTLDQCLKHKVHPTAWSPLGGGAIFSKNPGVRIERIKQVCSKLSHKYDASTDQLLLAWLMKHPAGIIPVTGTSKIERIESALAATKINLSHEEWYELWQASTGEEVA